MGYQVEYVIGLRQEPAREWLSQLSGFWGELESPDELAWGEFEWSGQAVFADLGPAACHVRVPCIKYSWLIHDDEPSLTWVAHFEAWMSEVLPDVRAVRVDQFLRSDWEVQTAREWWQWPDPVQAIREWLSIQRQYAPYFHLLPEEEKHA